MFLQASLIIVLLTFLFFTQDLSDTNGNESFKEQNRCVMYFLLKQLQYVLCHERHILFTVFVGVEG